jgi:hypothetical protein
LWCSTSQVSRKKTIRTLKQVMKDQWKHLLAQVEQEAQEQEKDTE